MKTGERVIVCGVDGSAASRRALRWAVDEARTDSARVRAVIAWAWDGLEELGAPTTPTAAQERAQQVLDKAVDETLLDLEEAPTVERVCARGVPSDALCIAAADADLLVVGSHGHGAVHDKLIGSTSERVTHHAPCPVVIVPDPTHAKRNLERAKARQALQEPSHPMQVV